MVGNIVRCNRGIPVWYGDLPNIVQSCGHRSNIVIGYICLIGLEFRQAAYYYYYHEFRQTEIHEKDNAQKPNQVRGDPTNRTRSFKTRYLRVSCMTFSKTLSKFSTKFFNITINIHYRKIESIVM